MKNVQFSNLNIIDKEIIRDTLKLRMLNFLKENEKITREEYNRIRKKTLTKIK